jgi:hypothetical protein
MGAKSVRRPAGLSLVVFAASLALMGAIVLGLV